jgi:hypothetical protein
MYTGVVTADSDVAAGGFILLVILLIVGTIVIGLTTLMVKGFRAAEQFDRRRAIERNMRQSLIDAGTEREVARKLLKEAGYE